MSRRRVEGSMWIERRRVVRNRGLGASIELSLGDAILDGQALQLRQI